jgi:hypothetical protein
LATALTARFRLPPSLAGTPRTPALGGLLARRTAIPRLRAVGLEELLAAFQQAAATPRPEHKPVPPERVARQIVDAIRRGKAEIIPYFWGRVLVWLNRLSPRLMDRIMRRYV